MEKTLREELEEEFDIVRTEGMLHSKDGKHSLSSEADAESIIEFISQRIKAKALTDEQKVEITDKVCKAYRRTWEQMVKEPASEGLIIAIYEAIAAAQLQAVLELFDSLNVKGIE